MRVRKQKWPNFLYIFFRGKLYLIRLLSFYRRYTTKIDRRTILVLFIGFILFVGISILALSVINPHSDLISKDDAIRIWYPNTTFTDYPDETIITFPNMTLYDICTASLIQSDVMGVSVTKPAWFIQYSTHDRLHEDNSTKPDAFNGYFPGYIIIDAKSGETIAQSA